MNYTSEFYHWLLSSLFILGILLIPIGLSFMLVPNKIIQIANRMNKWITTEPFFQTINKPIYKERFFYRHNKIIGFMIFLTASICLYLLTIDTGIDSITIGLINFAESAFGKWLLIVMYYILLVTLFLAFLFGVIMFVRPSSLKSFEEAGNRWIDTDSWWKVLDNQNELPDKILPGNPRVFGFIIVMAAIYIILNTSSI